MSRQDLQIGGTTTLEQVFRVRDRFGQLIDTTLILDQLPFRRVVEIERVAHLLTRLEDGLLVVHLGDLLLRLGHLQVGDQFATVEYRLCQLPNRIPHKLSGIRQLIARRTIQPTRIGGDGHARIKGRTGLVGLVVGTG